MQATLIHAVPTSDPLNGGPIRRRSFRLRTTAEMDQEDQPRDLGGPWAPAVREAVLDALADATLRHRAFEAVPSRDGPSKRSPLVRGSSSFRGCLCDWVREATGIEVGPAILDPLIASIGEDAIRERRRQRVQDRRRARYPHLGPFAVDFGRVRASRRRSKARLMAMATAGRGL